LRGHNKKTIHSPEYAVLLRLLRTARKDAGLTLEQVAVQLGYQASAVSKMERGELRLDYVQLRDYCRAVGVPLVEFVQRVEDALEGEK
jgi:transcriptional regulator with XRE-family HTH domain